MTKFSANLGFLWTELDLPDAIKAAKLAGFDAVECHWPYGTEAAEISQALKDTGLPMLGINTARGRISAGENGLSALPGREKEARALIDQAIQYGREIGVAHIHVMAGNCRAEAGGTTFVSNLQYACDRALSHGIMVLIEPLNAFDVPDYFLQTTDQALTIIDAVGRANCKLMFDCYHVQRMEGDLTQRLARLLPKIGHIQFASVPGRGVPDVGEINYRFVFKCLSKLGYSAPLGAEYKPDGPTEGSLNWMESLR